MRDARSSGIGNHFFYLLSEGSGTKSIGGVTHSSSAQQSAVAVAWSAVSVN
jgi:hypothetical protein